MMSDRSHAGGRNRLLSALRPHNLDLLQPHFQRVVLTRGQVLNRPGEPDFVYFLTKGMACLVGETSDGHTIQSAAIGSDSALNVPSAARLTHSCSKALVLIAGTAIRIPVERLQACAQSAAQIHDLIVCAHSLLLTQMQQTTVCNTLHGTEARLGRWLLDTSWRLEADDIPITQQNLAHLLGVHRGSLNATLQTLQRKGLIALVRRGTIAITGSGRLAAESCECHGRLRGCADEIMRSLAA
jgi:CRP-like cAMP-binding protein